MRGYELWYIIRATYADLVTVAASCQGLKSDR